MALDLLRLLLSLLTSSQMAQDAPTITITPESGQVEVALMMIEIAGLEANAVYAVEFVFEGEVVFASEETSDEEGHISYPAGSTAGDLPGIYTVQVLRDGEVIVSAEFELTASEDDGLPGDISVSPDAGPIGTVHTVTITELEPQSQYTVEITASEALKVGYRRQHDSDDDGLIEIEIFAEAGDSPGQQAIAVYDDDGELIGQGEFTIDAPPERDVSVDLLPPVAHAGQSLEIRLSGLASFDNVSAEILSADDQLIDTVFARASNAGEATMTFNAPVDLALGVYSVEIVDSSTDEELASASLKSRPRKRMPAMMKSIPVMNPGVPHSQKNRQQKKARSSPAPASRHHRRLIGSTHVVTVHGLAPGRNRQHRCDI